MANPIEPDTKDWTWVLEEPCDECGFDAASVDPRALPALITAWTETWQDVLTRPGVGSRPDPSVWSPLEYACHVRDVYRVFGERVRLMLAEDTPTFPNWDQDETAVSERYGEQRPDAVSEELGATGAQVAAAFASVGPDQWDRPGLRSNGSAFTVASLGRYFAHDVLHHLHDVRA